MVGPVKLQSKSDPSSAPQTAQLLCRDDYVNRTNLNRRQIRAEAELRCPTTAATAAIAASIPARSTSQCVTIRTSNWSVALHNTP
jgi:hypothetical protein